MAEFIDEIERRERREGGLRPPTPEPDRWTADKPFINPPTPAPDRWAVGTTGVTFDTKAEAEEYVKSHCMPGTPIRDRYDPGDPHIPAPANPPNPKQRFGDTKVNLALVPSSGVIYAALGFHDGAIKYGSFNWRKDRVEIMTYVAACRRHLDAFVDGEELSEEELWNNPDASAQWATVHLGQKPHLGHAIACLMILADAMSLGHVIDNRPPAGPAPTLFQKWKHDLAR